MSLQRAAPASLRRQFPDIARIRLVIAVDIIISSIIIMMMIMVSKMARMLAFVEATARCDTDPETQGRPEITCVATLRKASGLGREKVSEK